MVKKKVVKKVAKKVVSVAVPENVVSSPGIISSAPDVKVTAEQGIVTE